MELKKNNIEEYLELNTKGDKTKLLISVLREKWLVQDDKLIRFLLEIKEGIYSLI